MHACMLPCGASAVAAAAGLTCTHAATFGQVSLGPLQGWSVKMVMSLAVEARACICVWLAAQEACCGSLAMLRSADCTARQQEVVRYMHAWHSHGWAAHGSVMSWLGVLSFGTCTTRTAECQSAVLQLPHVAPWRMQRVEVMEMQPGMRLL